MKIVIVNQSDCWKSLRIAVIPWSVEKDLPKKNSPAFKQHLVLHRVISKDDTVRKIVHVQTWPTTKKRTITQDGFTHPNLSECENIEVALNAIVTCFARDVDMRRNYPIIARHRRRYNAD